MIDIGWSHSHEMQVLVQIRPLHENDPATMAAAFQRIGWRKTEAQYRRYLEEQAAERRVCLVALVEGRFGGYVTLNWRPTYPPFAEAGIPEIQDLNVLPEFQRQGIASQLLDDIEALAAERTSVAGLAWGCIPDTTRRNACTASEDTYPMAAESRTATASSKKARRSCSTTIWFCI
jgi:GNAT superfamily N-acetyltransferase